MGIAKGCIQQLGELAIYEYNWSMGEQHRWESAVWLPADEMLDELQSIKGNGRSGDIYGRLRKQTGLDMTLLTVYCLLFTLP